MFGLLPESPSPSIRDWEHAGAVLGTALQNYLALSQTLETNALNDGISPDDLAARIDCAMRSLHLVADHIIAQARSTLVRTRNRMVSPILRLLPDEVLSHIFANVIYEPVDPTYTVAMSKSLTATYRSLHTLLGVCSTWRNVILAEGSFWSIIPIVDWDPSPLAFKFDQATELSIERSRGRPLHLAAIRGHEWAIPPVLAENATRFRSLNISAKSHVVIGSTLEPFLATDSNRILSDLSIRVEPKETPQNNPLADFDYLFPLQDSLRASFGALLNSLSVLRICGIPVRWDQVAFSNRLVELQLQEVTMGSDIEMLNLFNALASATELRCLKIVAVRTFRDPAMGMVDESLPQVDLVLPRLRTLLIQNLYINTLALILGSISSRSHDLTLILTHKCLERLNLEESEPEEFGFDVLRDLLATTSVTELLLDADSGLWLEPSELATVMRSLPDLDTLRLYFWLFDKDYCKALTRPQSIDLSSQRRSFPCLKKLHLSWGRVSDEAAFRTMVTSHSESLEWMSFGASIHKLLIDETLEWDTLEEEDELAIWAQQNVPNLLLRNPNDPIEFQIPEWQLW